MAKNILFKIIFLFILLVFPFSTFAQIRSGDVTLTISPDNPTEGEEVTATLTSYLINLNIAYITWLKNDELISEGVGKNKVVFNVGDFNTDSTITARINTTGGDSLVKSITITPSEVDLIWEAVNSYTPPFYKGKALGAQEATFKVVAIPNVFVLGSKVSPQNLSYKWIKDGKVSNNSSGWAKNYFTFKQNYLNKNNEIEVEAVDILGKVKTFGKITIESYNPKVVFYKKDPQFGLEFKNAISDSYTLAKEGSTLSAVPYFFSPKDIKSEELSVKWLIDGETISTPANKFDISLRGEEGGSGNSAVKIIVNNTKTLFQELETFLSVNY